MNTYFSRNEKFMVTRVMLLSGLLEETIAEYEKVKTDSKFMKGIRMANTYGKKIRRH